MHYLQQWSCREKVKVHIESEDSQGDRWDVVQAHLEQLGGQEQQSQLGGPLSVPHTENSLGRDNCEIIFRSFPLYEKTYNGRSQETELLCPSDHWGGSLFVLL